MNILEELKINKAHLDEESINAPLKTQIFLNLYFIELKKLNDIQIEYDETYAKRLRYYKTEYDLIPENISELKLLLNGDKELNKKKEKLNNINLKIHKLKEIVQQFRDRQWAIKNAIEFLKFTKGDVN